MKCPRCNSTVLGATDEFGNQDDHCYACGWRAQAPSDADRARLMAEWPVRGQRAQGIKL